MAQFTLSDKQAEAILDLKLRHLAKLEETKIRGEQNELNQERKGLEKTLGSPSLLTELIKTEITSDAQTYGDERCSPLVERIDAAPIKAMDILPSEPITVVLSAKGWVRAAKGHDIDPTQLSYKSGDEYLAHTCCKTTTSALFFDSTGRVYTVPCHQLPSARGQGEPITGRLNPPSGAHFCQLLSAETNKQLVLASSAGYGFITTIEDCFSKNRNGKALLTLPTGSQLLTPQLIQDLNSDQIAVVTNTGYLHVFPLNELPLLTKGKGNKMISIPSAKSKVQEEYVVGIAILNVKSKLKVYTGKRHAILSHSDLSHYIGTRGHRG